jgi:multiple sugar transport system substrate-binding protein
MEVFSTMKRTNIALSITSSLLLLTACSSGGSTPGATGTLQIEDYYTASRNGPAYTAAYTQCATKVGVKFTRQVVPESGLMAKVLQQASSKTLPDVLMVDNPNTQTLAAGGALASLDNMGIQTAPYYPAINKAGTYKGHLYAAEPVPNTISLFYNTKLLEQAGITTPPTTWSELAADAKKLTNKGTYGLAFSAIGTPEGAWQFLPFMWSNGGDETNLNTPQVAESLQFLRDLITAGSASASTVTWDQSDVADQFTAGKAAMMVNGPWNIPTLAKFPAIDWKIAPMPTPKAGGTPVYPLGGEAFAVANTGKTATEKKAGEFLKCLVDDNDVVMALAKATNQIPGKIALAEQFKKAEPKEAILVDALPNARARTGKLGDKWTTVVTNIFTAEQLALTGKATPAQALKQATNG